MPGTLSLLESSRPWMLQGQSTNPTLFLVYDAGMRHPLPGVPALFLAQTQQISEVSTVSRTGPSAQPTFCIQASLTPFGLVSRGDKTRGPSTLQFGEEIAHVSTPACSRGQLIPLIPSSPSLSCLKLSSGCFFLCL